MTETNTRRPILRRTLTAAALVAGGIVIGAGGLAVAGGEMGPMGPMGGGMMGWHHHHHRGVGVLQRRVRGALDNVGATTAQEDKVHDIIANASVQIDKDRQEDGSGMRKQILELMKAPTLDRDAFEKLRAQKVAEMEAKSKVISGALFDAAGQLTPEQRAKLVGDFEARMDRGWFGHRRDGEHGGMDRGPDGHGPDGRGPEGRGPHGPDGQGPDRPDRG